MREDFRAKLAASRSVRSLAMEQQVAREVERRKWLPTHGFFYRDFESGKIREIDFVGTQRWSLKREWKLLDLHLLIECKSTADYHVVFSPPSVPNVYGSPPNQWIAKEETLAALLQALLTAGVSAAELREIKNGIHEARTLAKAPLMVDVLPPTRVGTSFKETNVGTDKDLDNSVLWRATQALASAVASLQDSERRRIVADIVNPSADDLLAGRSVMPRAVSRFADFVRYQHAYHPIVVTEARLWLLARDQLSEIPWCRFELRGEYSIAESWYDVVTLSHLPAFLDDLTSYYAEHLRGRKARRSRIT